MCRVLAALAIVLAAGAFREAQALEVLAYIPAYTTATGFTIPAGLNGPSSIFSSITLTTAGVTAVNDPSYAQYSGLSTTTDGNPATNYLQIAFVKNPAFTNYNITFTGLYVAAGKTSAQSLELHSYSNVGGFTTGITNQLTAGGLGYVVTSNPTPPATATLVNYDTATTANRTIASGTNNFQIRIAPDRGGSTNLLLNTFSGTFEGSAVSNAMFVLVGDKSVPVPEPRSYVLSAVSVVVLALAARRRQRFMRAAQTA